MLILRIWQLVLNGVLLTARWWKALKSNGPVCCGEPMQPAYNAQEGMVLRAWYCTLCKHIEPAIGRERLFTPETLDAVARSERD